LSNRAGPPDPGNETAARLAEAGGSKTNVKASNFRQAEYVGAGLSASRKVPSRATIARKWPALKINRLTWRWVDDASGARGDDLFSLLQFLGRAS